MLAPTIRVKARAAMTEAPIEAPTEVPADDRPPIPVRCRETGFRVKIPVADWEAYTQAQRDAYERLDAPQAHEDAPQAAKARKSKEG